MTRVKDVLEIKNTGGLKIVHSYSLSLDRNYQLTSKQNRSIFVTYYKPGQKNKKDFGLFKLRLRLTSILWKKKN